MMFRFSQLQQMLWNQGYDPPPSPSPAPFTVSKKVIIIGGMDTTVESHSFDPVL